MSYSVTKAGSSRWRRGMTLYRYSTPGSVCVCVCVCATRGVTDRHVVLGDEGGQLEVAARHDAVQAGSSRWRRGMTLYRYSTPGSVCVCVCVCATRGVTDRHVVLGDEGGQLEVAARHDAVQVLHAGQCVCVCVRVCYTWGD
ncbi:hypothetical protein ACJJTC_018645 [Scirpophaga incertulas]